MNREDLMLQILCATAVAERDGLENAVEALCQMLKSLALYTKDQGSDLVLNEIITQLATAPQNLTIQ